MNYWKTKAECLNLTEKMRKKHHLASFYYYNMEKPIVPNGFFTPKTPNITIREHFYVDIQNNKEEVAREYLNIELIKHSLTMIEVPVKKRFLEHTNFYSSKNDYLHVRGEFKTDLLRIIFLYNELNK